MKFDSSAQQYLEYLKIQLEGKKSFVHIPGDKYRALLVHFGAAVEDLRTLESGRIHDQVLTDREKTMSFRQIAFHRVLLKEECACCDAFKNEKQETPFGRVPSMGSLSDDTDSVEEASLSSSPSTSPVSNRRGLLSKQPSRLSVANCEAVTQISGNEICSKSGANVYFERSGTRKWNMPPEEYSASSIPMAMAKINDFLQPAVHHHQPNLNTESPVTINDQLLIRINKESNRSSDVAEPTPEGIHQDGTEISSVTVIGRVNVKKDEGGESRIWNLKQPTGNYNSLCFGKLEEDSFLTERDNFDWENCMFNKALESPWETIIFNDREVKHEARAFFRAPGMEEGEPCHRDVIVNFVRKPCLDGSDEEVTVEGRDGAVIRRRSSIV